MFSIEALDYCSFETCSQGKCNSLLPLSYDESQQLNRAKLSFVSLSIFFILSTTTTTSTYAVNEDLEQQRGSTCNTIHLIAISKYDCTSTRLLVHGCEVAERVRQ